MKLKTFLTILISGVFLTLAVWNFNSREFMNAVGNMNPLYFFPALSFYLLSFLFRTIRWRVMLRSVKPITHRSVFSYIVIGYMANNLLPARLGEIVRAYVTGKRERMSRSSVFASVVLERLFDGLTILIILLVLMFAAGVDRGWLRYMAWGASALFLGGLGFFFALAYQRERAISMTESVVRCLPDRIAEKVMHILRRFTAGLVLLREPRDFFISFIISFIVWTCEVMVYYIYLKAFGIDVPFIAALLALVVVNLSSLIPSSPSYIGVFQYACVKSLQVFGVGSTTALAWSVAIHSTQIIPITLLGLFILSRMGLSMGEISRAEMEEAEKNGENGYEAAEAEPESNI